MKLLKSILIGICAGFITGFFSAGGGMLILPALIYLQELNEKEARATTIFTILPMVITSAFFYYKGNYMNVQVGLKCAIGGIIGSFLGTKLTNKISNKYLKLIFIIFLIYAAFNLIK